MFYLGIICMEIMGTLLGYFISGKSIFIGVVFAFCSGVLWTVLFILFYVGWDDEDIDEE